MMLFITKIQKGNNKGVGFIRIPLIQRKHFKINENFKITIVDGKTNPIFYSRIKEYSGLGVYVPKDIVIKNDLLYKEFQINFQKIDGFYAVLSNDGRFYIPRDIFESSQLEYDDIILVSAGINGIEKEKFCRVKKRIKDNGIIDCFCMFDPKLAGKPGIFKIKKKIKNKNCSDTIYFLLKNFNFGIFNGKAVVFYGHMVPIKINIDIKISDIAYYLGCFFSDGTKRGNSWGLCASTFQQARYFIDMHKKLISDAKLNMHISFSDLKETNKIKGTLIRVWYKNTSIKINKTRFHKSEARKPQNRNEFGTLVLKEYRKLTQIYYNRLVEYLCKKVQKEDDKKLATEFICGVLEGDGSPSSRRDGNIIIATNKEEIFILDKILKYTNLQYNIREDKPGKFIIRLTSLSVLKNIPFLKDRLFEYYPKRRLKFIKRFQNVGAVRFILGEQNYASGWVKAYLKKNKILDDEYKLTKFGKKIKTCLKDMIKEVDGKNSDL